MIVNWYKVAMGNEDLDLPSVDEVGDYALGVMEEVREKELEDLRGKLLGYEEYEGNFFKLRGASVPALIIGYDLVESGGGSYDFEVILDRVSVESGESEVLVGNGYIIIEDDGDLDRDNAYSYRVKLTDLRRSESRGDLSLEDKKLVEGYLYDALANQAEMLGEAIALYGVNVGWSGNEE